MTRVIVIALVATACGGEPFERELFGDGGAAGSTVDAPACGPSVIQDQCGKCPPGYYPSAIHDTPTSCAYQLRDCSRMCPGESFTMCSLSAPCPSGWTEVEHVLVTACTTETRPNGSNAIVCEP
jgi:hypothetical protein